ncbi:MAG: Hsp20/alpha crystallin family protein [Candidatus Bathyarchaeota archaeon]|nr:Hsp20/alpha crystallin family protein [Candidatus Bathyarchaeota archaeon]MCX8177981.1 Hsp20/alpha crystallin family protein [Candidatus Bathyarchaeota archaeon]MDW8194539.1 archaeal heat shock protein Hsp20 [Nitrososphaerota archaeon]
MAFDEDEEYPSWFRRRRFPFFGSWFFEDIDRMFREMEKAMEEEFKIFTSRVPKDYVRERKLPDGSVVRELGPFVYGYSIKIGPDGKPEIREFGNVKPSKFGPKVKEEREPLVDIVETDKEVHIVAELPGVEKEDIKLHGTEDTLTISVETPQRKYYKEIKLPAKVRVKDTRTQYKNGVLEVIMPKMEEGKPKGEPIKIE